MSIAINSKHFHSDSMLIRVKLHVFIPKAGHFMLRYLCSYGSLTEEPGIKENWQLMYCRIGRTTELIYLCY